MICFGPIVVYGLYLLNKGAEQHARASDTSYRKAGGIAEEALQEIKTVASLNGQRYEARKYSRSLTESQKYMTAFGFKTGLGIGLGMFGFMMMTAAVFMVGAVFINDGTKN